MAANTNITAVAGQWTLLTTNDAAQATFQNLTNGVIKVKGTVGAVTPTNEDGAIAYPPFNGEMNANLSEMFPGITGVNRLYVKSGLGGSVPISHD